MVLVVKLWLQMVINTPKNHAWLLHCYYNKIMVNIRKGHLTLKTVSEKEKAKLKIWLMQVDGRFISCSWHFWMYWMRKMRDWGFSAWKIQALNIRSFSKIKVYVTKFTENKEFSALYAGQWSCLPRICSLCFYTARCFLFLAGF